MFKSTHQLKAKELNELEALANDCLQVDGSLPSLYKHILAQERSLPASILYYENNRLTGFISAFFFYEDAVEISLLIAPDRRRKGLAKQLIQRVLPLIQRYGFRALIFSCPAKRLDQWLIQQGFTFLHSEYHMKRNDLNPLLDIKTPYPIRFMQESDIPSLIHLDELCFLRKQDQAQAESRFHFLMNDEAYSCDRCCQRSNPRG